GSKRRRVGKEPESTTPQKEKTSKIIGKSTKGSKSHHKSADKSSQAEEPMHTVEDLEEPTHQEFVTGDTKDKPDEETSQLPDYTLAQKVDTFGPIFKLMKGSCKSLVELEYFFKEVYKATTDQLEWNNPEGQQYPHDLRKPLPLIPNSRVTKTKAADYRHIKWIEDLVPNIMWSQVPVSYEKYALWGISHWGQKRQQLYGFAANRESARDHLDWITVRRDDDKLYKFKEGDFNMLRIQDIKDMLLLLVQGKLTNLTVEKRLAFNLPKEAQPHKARYVQNRFMRIDELHKFSNGTLNDVWTALDDRLKGIWIKYLPQNIWKQSDKDKAGAMIQAIDKQLKTRRIMRSLEKFIDKMDSMHSTLSMYYDYDAHVKGELLVMMKNSQSVNLLIFISNTLIELFNDFGFDCDGIPERPTMYLNLWSYKVVRYRFDTSAGNPVKEILLKLNLPDHRILKDGHGGTDTPYLLDGYGVLRQWSFNSSKSWIRRIGLE
ncbi:hypothetical protein Tco_1035631, partial [Tanacetum coccineum]